MEYMKLQPVLHPDTMPHRRHVAELTARAPFGAQTSNAGRDIEAQPAGLSEAARNTRRQGPRKHFFNSVIPEGS